MACLHRSMLSDSSRESRSLRRSSGRIISSARAYFVGRKGRSDAVLTRLYTRRWYKSGELGKRSGIFTSSGLAGTL